MAVLTLLFMLLPPSSAKNWLLRRLGHRVSPSASLGSSLFVNVSRIVIGDDARVGAGNVVRNLHVFNVGPRSGVGQFNWISASAELVARGAPGTFHLGESAALTSRHYVDCSGGVTIGDFATVGGVRTTVMTHGIDVDAGEQRVSPVSIGDRSLVSSNTSIVPGARVPRGTVVAMGAVVSRSDRSPGMLLAGVPARATKPVAGRYFTRREMSVELPTHF